MVYRLKTTQPKKKNLNTYITSYIGPTYIYIAYFYEIL
mgnify:CR=1 FL=1